MKNSEAAIHADSLQSGGPNSSLGGGEDRDDKNVRHTMYSRRDDNKNTLSNNADNNNDCCLYSQHVFEITSY